MTFNWTIDVGTILTMIVMVCSVGGALWKMATWKRDIEKDMLSLKEDLTKFSPEGFAVLAAEVHRLREDMNLLWDFQIRRGRHELRAKRLADESEV